MEEYNNPVFAQAKIEYTKQLKDVLQNPLYEGLQSIYNDSKEEYSLNTTTSIYVMFRKKIENVPKWNTDMIEEEVDRIMRVSDCDWLEDLITAVFVSHTKILASIGNNRTKKINLTIPKTTNFIHKCYINTAREIWKNPYLFDESVSSSEYQINIKSIEELIKENIDQTIRKLLPVKEILRDHLDNTDVQNPNIEEERKTKDIQKLLMEELMILKRKEEETDDMPEEKYFDDHVNDKMIEENTKNIEINDIVTNDVEPVYDNPEIVEKEDESVVSVDEKLNNYKNIIEENRDKVKSTVLPAVVESLIQPQPQPQPEPEHDVPAEPEPEPEQQPQLDIRQLDDNTNNITNNIINNDISNINTVSEIEREIENNTIKTIQTTKGTGKVETVVKETEQSIREDDTITLDNFMDDMSNMIKKNEDYNLFSDANDIG